MGILSAMYRVILEGRNFYYSSFKEPDTLPARVVSIGNLTLGGTGKTPAVIALAQEAKKRGMMPCILTRGYKGKAGGPCFVGEDQRSEFLGQGKADLCILPLDPSICGDEPVLMASRLKEVPIVKSADRFKGGQFAISNFKFQISKLLFILDDGFQHRRLHRDTDILLIDGKDPFGNDRLFPEGRLREPLSSMKRAHIIVITKADMATSSSIESLTGKIRKYNPDAPLFNASHKPISIVRASGETIGLDILNNRKVYVFAGIANPTYFRETLTTLGADITGLSTFRDHHAYKQKHIDNIISISAGADIITTEKDMVKLKGLRLPENLFALRIDFEIDSGFYDIILKEQFNESPGRIDGRIS